MKTPTLGNPQNTIEVLTSRIPYYVGPLDSTDHGKAGENGTRFAWVKRLAGHEDAFVSPWNYEDHIDIDTTAELFIRRMTGECSYLDGEDVLAKNSLLYEKYCFFNELASPCSNADTVRSSPGSSSRPDWKVHKAAHSG